MNRSMFSVLLLLAASGCVQTSELPLAENVVLIQATGVSSGLISRMIVAEQLPKQTVHRAAQATIARGYTHFRISSSSGQTAQIGNTPLTGHVVGNSIMLSGGRPITSRDMLLTVVMYRPGEAGAEGAIDAAYVLKELNPT